MTRRFLALLLPVALAAAGCGGDDISSGAARVVMDWHDFAPGCLRLTAKGDAGDPVVKDLTLEDGARTGEKVIAVYRGKGWGPDVGLTAQAFEGSCASGKVVAEATDTAHITSGVVEISFTFTAQDQDKDGFVAASGDHPGSDCDDSAATGANVHPGAAEVCNMVDDNCDGNIDEGVALSLYRDEDGDGFGAGPVFLGCTVVAPYVENDTDCDDNNPKKYPGNTEICDGLDNDCNTIIDDGFPMMQTFYEDLDMDGHGNPNAPKMACTIGAGLATSSDDCNDNDANVKPGATEVCNMVDDNCNGSIDEGVQLTFHLDNDGDGFGGPMTTLACAAPTGYVTDATDCDDNAAAVHPGATETCNMVDDNCNGTKDEGVQTAFYPDVDGDGFGNPMGTVQMACAAPMGFVTDNTDCNDNAAAVHPGATETCNGVDDNCVNGIDEGLTQSFYADVDMDGYGAGAATVACSAPVGFVAQNGDCNDSDPQVHPGQAETRCDQADDNCDGQIDEGLTVALYPDKDFDTYGDSSAQQVMACPNTPGFVTNNTDCDDGNYFKNPGRTEACDGLDNNCNGMADEGLTCSTTPWATPTGAGGNNEDYERLGIVSSGAWAVGTNTERYFGNNNSTNSNYDTDCGSAWHAATGNYLTNDGIFGGESGRLGRHTVTNTPACNGITYSPGGATVTVRGLAYPADDFTFTTFSVYGVTAGGFIFRVDPAPTPMTVSTVTTAPGTYYDFDAIVSSLGYAVGSHTVNSNVKAYIVHATSATTWAADTINSSVTLPTGAELRSVSVALQGGWAVAVGDQGLVLQRGPNPTDQWNALPTPTGATNLTSVKSFGKNLVYACGVKSTGSDCWRWDGTAWTALAIPTAGNAPRDIDGDRPSNLWIAGDNGLLRHFTP